MAGSALIGALRVNLGLDSAQFETGLKRARGTAKREATEIQKVMGGVKAALGGLVAVETAQALGAATRRALDYAGGLGELAKQAGISTKALQEYAAIGVDVGLSNEDIVSSFGRLSKTIGAAQDGNKKAADTFRQLGIDVTGLTAESAMPKLIEAFERIKSPTDQARIAADLFGRNAGAKLLPLLNMTTKGMDEAREAAHRLGLVLSDEAIESADAASDSLAMLARVAEVNFTRAILGSADSITVMSQRLAEMIAKTADAIGWLKSLGNTAGVLAEMGLLGPTAMPFGKGAIQGSVQNMSRKELAAAARRTKDALAKDPNNKEYVDYAWMLVNEERSRGAPKRKPGVATGGDLVPRTSRPGKTSGGGGRDRSADYLERFERELAGLQDEQLRLQQQITTDVGERARLEHLRIDTELEAYRINLDGRQKAGELTKAQAEALRLQYEQNAEKQRTAVNWRLDDELTEQELELHRSAIGLQNDALARELDGARTQEDRRRIQLRILENEIELERAALEAVKAKHDSTQVEKDIAQAKLDQLGREQEARADGVRRDTMGPLDTWLDEGRKNAAEMRESLEGITVDALNGSLDLATRNMFKLKGAAGELMNQILSDVIRLQLRSMMSGSGGLIGGLIGAVGGLFGGGGGGAVPSSWGDTSVLGGAIDWNEMTAGAGLPRLATGGSFMAGGNSGVDRNVLAINGIPKVRVSADERISVTPAGQDNSPIVIQMYSEEGPAMVPRVSAISEGVTMQNMTRSAAYSARAGRQRLVR